MRRNYKNVIFETLLKHPAGIENFDFIDSTNYQVLFKYGGETMQFTFESSPLSFDIFSYTMTKYTPDFRIEINKDARKFEIILESFKYWLVAHCKDLYDDKAGNDLWTDYKKQAAFSSIKNEDYSNFENFSNHDRASIKLALEEIKGIIIERFTKTDEQIIDLNLRIDYLTEAVGRLNKTDWRGIFLSTIINITVALTLSPKEGQELMNLFLSAIRVMPIIGTI